MTKGKTPVDDNASITNALTESGTFLQIVTADILIKSKFEVDWEYPLAVAPFISNPIQDLNRRHMNNPPNREYLQVLDNARNFQRQEETTMDIVATKRFESAKVIFTLCIEVKKRNPKYVKWVFIKQRERYALLKAPIISMSNEGPILLKVPPLQEISNELYVIMSDSYTRKFPPEMFLVYDYARALKRDNKGNLEVESEFYHAEQTDVDKSCRQICKQTSGLLLDKITELVSTHAYERVVNVFIPIVVTNAELVTCEYDMKSIDPEVARPTKEPQYETVNSLVYDCSLPDTARFPLPDVGPIDTKLRRHLSKWHVYIMTVAGLFDFLNYLNRAWG